MNVFKVKNYIIFIIIIEEFKYECATDCIVNNFYFTMQFFARILTRK